MTDSSSIVHQSGGVNLDSNTVNIGGDVVGRDKIIQETRIIHERALTAAEEARQAKSIEREYLAQGVSSLAQNLQARAQQSGDAAAGGPYRGLLAYSLGDAEIFFGRRQAIRELWQHLARGALTVLHAESGAGKTSLLQAGLAPRLIGQGHLPLHVRPYDQDPAEKIKREIIPNFDQMPLLKSAPLRAFLRQVCSVLGAQATLYVMLDQFEEFFARLDEPLRTDFVRQFAECLDDESLNVRWVLALRSEYFGNLADFRPRIRNPFDNDYRLNRLTRTEAQEGIVKPAARRGVTFEDGLIDTLLDDLGKDEIAPPQLQLVCSSLYDELAAGQTTITRALYEREGKAARILRGHLERVLSRDLPSSERSAARRLLESLITSESQRVIRAHSELVAEMSKQGVTPQTLDVILNHLVDSRLLRVEEADAELAFELAHDYLLAEIKLDPEVQARKAAQELLEQEMRANRRYNTLISADRLKAIEPYRNDLVFTLEAAALFAESEAAAQSAAQRAATEREAQRQRELELERQGRRRLRTLVGVLGVLLLLSVGFILYILYPNVLALAARGETVNIDGGEVVIGTNDPTAISADRPALTASVTPFEIERFEVSNRQYRLCVDAHVCQPPLGPSSFRDDTQLDYPIVDVSAVQAALYCSWLGRRLPTEPEWERAAELKGAPTAPGADRPWPWGTGTPAPAQANVGTRLPGPQPINSYPEGATREGVFNLVGNVWEWTSTYYQNTPPYNPKLNWDGQAITISSTQRLVARGGSWRDTMPRLTHRYLISGDLFSESVGFRCAASR